MIREPPSRLRTRAHNNYIEVVNLSRILVVILQRTVMVNDPGISVVILFGILVVNGVVFSNTALISAFGILTEDLYQQPVRGSLEWDLWGSIASVEQVNLRYVPIPPHTGSVPLPQQQWSMDDGIWAHISHGNLAMPMQKQTLRRIQQTANGEAVSILVSAESFYKGGSGMRRRTKGGLHAGTVGLSGGGMFANGREIVFRREGAGTSGALEQMIQAFSTQATSLVSQAFSLRNLVEVELDFDGMLRDGITFSIEGVDARGNPIPGTMLNLGLPEAPGRFVASKRKYSRFLFTGVGRNVRYRFRIDGPVGFVAFEESITEDLSDAFSKSASEDVPLKIVELGSGIVEDIGTGNSIVIAPNPATFSVEIRSFFNIDTEGPYLLSIHDVAGRQRIQRTVSRSEQVGLNIEELENGTYIIHVTSGDGTVLSQSLVVYR